MIGDFPNGNFNIVAQSYTKCSGCDALAGNPHNCDCPVMAKAIETARENKDVSDCSAHWVNPITGRCPDCGKG